MSRVFFAELWFGPRGGSFCWAVISLRSGSVLGLACTVSWYGARGPGKRFLPSGSSHRGPVLLERIATLGFGRPTTPFLEDTCDCPGTLELKSAWRQKGGGGYFLPRLIGPEQAWNVMLSDKDITAFEAIGIGVIHEIAPSEHLQKIAFCRAEKYAQKSSSALSIIKQLMYFSIRDFTQYLEYEDKLLMNTVSSRKFWGKMKQA